MLYVYLCTVSNIYINSWSDCALFPDFQCISIGKLFVIDLYYTYKAMICKYQEMNFYS